MGLAKKNFLYSILISLIIVLMITGYFIFMLPSLYEAHMMDVNYQSVLDLHRSFMENGSYEGSEVRNPTGCVSVKIPKDGDMITLAGMNYKIEITVLDDDLKKLMNKVGDISRLSEEEMNALWEEFEKSDLLGQLTRQAEQGTENPFKIEIETDSNYWNNYMNTDMKFHQVNDHLFVTEALASDEFNQYISYFAIETENDGITVTTLPVMAPKINEIRPVVLNSLPMITLVVFLLVLLFSQLYSRKIVNPIIRISHYTESAVQVKEEEADGQPEKLKVESKDEIGILAQSINEMYIRLTESYMELKKKNDALADENKRQEVFMRATSHQLKTPIAAALLLTEGMIGEVGKYRDTKEYLPQVKNQLLSMKEMVDSILYLNDQIAHINYQEVDVRKLTESILACYRVQMEEKNLTISMERGELVQKCDEELLAKILDNLISNAVNYTKEGQKIVISLQNKSWMMRNYGSRIDDEILPHIFEPFVSGNHRIKGHGLGLYVAAYYAGLLGIDIKLNNEADAVKTELLFSEMIGEERC